MGNLTCLHEQLETLQPDSTCLLSISLLQQLETTLQPRSTAPSSRSQCRNYLANDRSSLLDYNTDGRTNAVSKQKQVEPRTQARGEDDSPRFPILGPSLLFRKREEPGGWCIGRMETENMMSRRSRVSGKHPLRDPCGKGHLQLLPSTLRGCWNSKLELYPGLFTLS